MKKYIILVVVLCAVIGEQADAQIFDSMKRSVAFVFGRVHVKGPNGNPLLVEMPLGTAFFVFQSDDRISKDGGFMYVTTARHVLKDADGSFLKTVRIRMNLLSPTKDTGFGSVELPVTDGAGKLLWYEDPSNSSSDVVAFPFLPDQKTFDVVGIPTTIFANEELFKREKVVEGDSLYFVGLMPQYYGDRKNYPVLRKGALALLTDEEIETPTGKQRAYLADMIAWPGNSGSPVLLNLGGQRETGLTVGFRFYFLGVLLGYYSNRQSAQTIDSATLLGGDTSNIGISFVLPAVTLRKTLDSEAAKKNRDIQVQQMKRHP